MGNCINCGRANGPGRDTCLYRGGLIEADAAAGPPKCPRCSAEMELEVVEGIELDICYSCGGTWYDKDELEEHLAKGAQEPGEDDAGATTKADWQRKDAIYLKCPKCGRPMNRVNFGRRSGTIVDVCGPHGVFLDAGELEEIQRFESSGKGDIARADTRRSQEVRERQEKRDRARQRQIEVMTTRRGWFGRWR